MIRAYDDNGNVVDLVEREQQIRVEVIAEISREMRLLYGNEYEQQIRAEERSKVIEKFAEEIKSLIYKWFEKGVINTSQIDKIAEQLKENK